MNAVISWNPVVIGVIAVIPASFFKGDWCYSNRSRENNLLQNQVKLSENRDFSPNRKLKALTFQVIDVKNWGDWCYSGHSREKDLLQKFEKCRVIGAIAVFPAQNFKE